MLRAARLPRLHSKLVCAKVAPKEESSGISYFLEASPELGKKGVLLSEEPDAEDCVVVELENHRCEPVEVEDGQVSTLYEAKLCVNADIESHEQGGMVSAILKIDFVEERVQWVKEGLKG